MSITMSLIWLESIIMDNNAAPRLFYQLDSVQYVSDHLHYFIRSLPRPVQFTRISSSNCWTMKPNMVTDTVE